MSLKARSILLPLLPLAATAHAQEPPAPRPFHLGGFADVELHTTSDNEREGLDLAELDIFSTYQLSTAWSALAEAVVLRSWRDRDEKFDGDLERLYLEYSTSDALRVEFGE